MFGFGKKQPSDYRTSGLATSPSNNGWYTCVRCKKSFRKGDIDIDHIIPQSKGGSNDPRNLQCMCKHCNRSKGNDTSRTVPDLIRRQGEYHYNQHITPRIKQLLKAGRNEARGELSRLSDADIKELLRDSELAKNSEAQRLLRSEARKRGLR